MDEAQIKNDAKKIMDNFMKSMKNIEVEEEYTMVRNECFREEGEGTETDEDFRQRFLSNAPKVSNEAILANKGDWE
jgi:Asp-tRNA(Asn)/Glu-tRNA(Gln) amidotransferase C subunit